jgi:hypothetical protein
MVPPPIFNPLMPVIDLVFTVIAVFFCFMIYFRTKESYDLTKHKGIKYFRAAFLFFALSYVMRFLFGLVMFSTFALDLDFILPRSIFGPLFILPLGYFSTIGIFYLIFSSIWKKFNNKTMLMLGHGLAVVLSVASFITRSHIMLLYLQSIFLVMAVVMNVLAHRGQKKVSAPRILYVLVSVLWLIDLWVIDKGGRRMPFSPGIELFFHAVSLLVFIIIYHKVSKWVK